MLYAYLLPPEKTPRAQPSGPEMVHVAANASHVIAECWRKLSALKPGGKSPRGCPR